MFSLDQHVVPGTIKLIKRDGQMVPFDAEKIIVAMRHAFIATEENFSQSDRIADMVRKFTNKIVDQLIVRYPSGGSVHIEEIQDMVEHSLMVAGEHRVAREYILY